MKYLKIQSKIFTSYFIFFYFFFFPKSPLAAATAAGRGGTMGCHPMLTENAKFVTNSLRGDLSTVNVRP